MFRVVGSALFAVALTGGLFSVADAKSHTVAPGETIAMIAAREHVSAGRLTQLNDLDANAPLPAGTILGLDEAAVAARPATPITDPGTRADAAAQLQSVIASNPAAGADAAMWGESSAAALDPSTTTGETRAVTMPSLHRLASRILHRTSTIALTLTKNAMQFIGTPYVFGGTTPAGFDCSGYVQHVFAEIGIRLPRTADAQYYAGSRIRGEMVAGDLVFFQTYEPGPSHVGIYLGHGRFIHSSSHGVRISALSESYWANRYLGAKRFMHVPTI